MSYNTETSVFQYFSNLFQHETIFVENLFNTLWYIIFCESQYEKFRETTQVQKLNLQANFNFRPRDWYTKPLVFNEEEREGLQGIRLLLYGLSGVKLVTVIPVSHHFTNAGLMKYTVIPTVHCYGTVNGNSISKHTHKASDGIIFLLKQGTEHS